MPARSEVPREAVEALANEFEFRAAIAAQVGCEARSAEVAEFCTAENCALIEAASSLRDAAPAIRKQERESLSRQDRSLPPALDHPEMGDDLKVLLAAAFTVNEEEAVKQERERVEAETEIGYGAALEKAAQAERQRVREALTAEFDLRIETAAKNRNIFTVESYQRAKSTTLAVFNTLEESEKEKA